MRKPEEVLGSLDGGRGGARKLEEVLGSLDRGARNPAEGLGSLDLGRGIQKRYWVASIRGDETGRCIG